MRCRFASQRNYTHELAPSFVSMYSLYNFLNEELYMGGGFGGDGKDATVNFCSAHK